MLRVDDTVFRQFKIHLLSEERRQLSGPESGERKADWDYGWIEDDESETPKLVDVLPALIRQVKLVRDRGFKASRKLFERLGKAKAANLAELKTLVIEDDNRFGKALLQELKGTVIEVVYTRKTI